MTPQPPFTATDVDIGDRRDPENGILPLARHVQRAPRGGVVAQSDTHHDAVSERWGFGEDVAILTK